MKQGDIYFVSLDPTMGREQRGLRPVIVLTSESFNNLTGSPLVAAITTGGDFARRNNFAVELPITGMKTTGLIRCDQVRTLDVDARRGRFVEAAPAVVIENVLSRLSIILARMP